MMLFAIRIDKKNVCMGIDNTRHSEVLPDRLTTSLIFCLHGRLDLQTVDFFSPIDSILIGLYGLVLPCIQANVNGNSRCFFRNLRFNVRRVSSRQLGIHDHTSDSNSLLATRLANCMETRTEQKLPEYFLDACTRNTRSIIFNFQLENVFLVIQFCNLDNNIW